MKYSEKCLWNAVYVFCPDYELARNSGVHLNLPESIQHAAKIAFIKCETVEYKTGIKHHVGSILREALVELNTVGWMTFGDQDEFVAVGSENSEFVVFGCDTQNDKFQCCFDGEATVWSSPLIERAILLANELKGNYPLTEYWVQDITGNTVYIAQIKKD